jgi:twitching motility protein PilT
MKEVIDELLIAAFHKKASDIHLTVGSPPVFRIHGELRTVEDLSLTPEQIEAMARAIIQE